MLTLYTTPVIYVYLDRFGKWCSALWARHYLRTPRAPEDLTPAADAT